MTLPPTIQYPLDKETYGRAFWNIIHSYTTNLPERLSTGQKVQFRQTVHNLLENFPCEDCRQDAKAWISDHRPNLNTGKDAFLWGCDFHNAVNEKLGKERQDCHALWESRSNCPSCSVVKADEDTNRDTTRKSSEPETNTPPIDHLITPSIPTSEHTATETNQITYPNIKNSKNIDQILSNYSLRPSLEEYKNATTKMVENICKNAGAPIPEIIFSDKTLCKNPDSSCVQMPVRNGKLVKEVPTRLLLNYNQYSPRTALHETYHYLLKYYGLDHLASNEQEISRQSREMIARDFPNGIMRVGAGKDTVEELSDESPKEPFDPLKYFKTKSKARLASFTNDLPYFSQYYTPNKKKHRNEPPSPAVQPTVTYSDGQPVFPQTPTVTEEPEPESASEGFVSMLDPIFAPFADVLGMKARDVNLAHTPALLANGAITLMESNLNYFGSMAVSLLTSGATLLAGTVGKESMGYVDKRLLVGLGGAFLWSAALRYLANPKINGEVMEEATQFASGLSTMDTEAMVASVMNTDSQKIPEKEPGMPPKGNWRKNLSAPLGGKEIPVKSYERSSHEVLGDIYTDPDLTIEGEHGMVGANQGTARFKRPPFFPSM